MEDLWFLDRVSILRMKLVLLTSVDSWMRGVYVSIKCLHKYRHHLQEHEYVPVCVALDVT